MRTKFSPIFFLLLITIPACNSSAEKKREQKSDSIVAIANAGSTKITDTLSSRDGFALSAGETKDAAVFKDGSIPASWTVAGIDEPVLFKKFLKHLKYWIANDQKDSIANVILFPLHNLKIKTKADFLKNYDLYINAKVKKAVREQNLSELFRNYQGVMIGSGEIWFAQTKNGFSIIAINNK